MLQVAPYLHVGSEADFQTLVDINLPDVLADKWAIVHACKEPHHREMLGYEGRAAPKDDPEYLFGVRGNRLVLNLVDAPDPAYVRPEIIDAALAYIATALGQGRHVLVHCNQGRSRSPVLVMLHLAPGLPAKFEDAEKGMLALYPEYAPAAGMRGFAEANWPKYQARTV